jgi:hypothetical protein
MVGEKEIKNKWFVALKPNKGDIFNTDGLAQLSSPPGRYYADPFIFKKDDVNYLFFEDTDYKKGVISCCTIDENLKISQPKVVLDRPYHLSFPCIFQEGDDIYMIPETGQRGTIEIYKSSEFPNKWELCKILVQGLQTADPVIFKHDGVWFLMCTARAGRIPQKQGVDQEIVSFDDGVLILYSDNILGDWSIHPKCKDLFPFFQNDSRLAGNIFKYQGKLIKPVQKRDPLSCRYGYGIGFKEIEITKTEYKEKNLEMYDIMVKDILPYWCDNLIGTHTFNFNEDFITLDGKIRVTKDTEELIEYKEQKTLFPSKDKNYVDYWFPRNKNYKTKDSIKERLENINILVSTLKKHNINSCLIFGTLLGAIRDNSLIPHDHDDDIFVFEKDKDLFTKDLIVDLEKQDMRLMRITDKGHTISFHRKGYYIDILFGTKKQNKNYQWREVEIDGYFFKKFDKVTMFNGDVYNTLNDPEKFLEKTYGNWKVPVKTNGWVNEKFSNIIL